MTLDSFASPHFCEPIRSVPLRLGATIVEGGTDFSLRAPHATGVTLCLFDESGSERRLELNNMGFGMWAGFAPGVGAGQLYGYRVHGRWAPESGLLYNPAKVLLDPYARAIGRGPVLDPSLFTPGYDADHTATLEPDTSDSARFAPLGAVCEELDRVTSHPRNPWNRTVIYEAHVKGLTMLNPEIPQEIRGSYAAMAHSATITHLKNLGVTAIELLPIHAKMDEEFLAERELTNYWGYNTLNFFSPEPSYASPAAREAGPQAVIDEVRSMVQALHEAGIEVLLDVVYNHTCEGPESGPTVSWRGIDNVEHYMLTPGKPSVLMDTTGCGNSLDFRRHNVIALALDSLRYWVERIGVDGFRFDLSVTLGRNGEAWDAHHPFYVAMVNDPVLRTVKLINEPWDLGPFGWRTGQFIMPMADWNDHFRNTVRAFWVSDPRSGTHGGAMGDLRDLATRLAGSADLFGGGRIPGGRGVQASINFVTAHDGFTLRDLVSFDTKHNEANGEGNRDGSDNNQSWNFGVEGFEEASEAIERRRRVAIRNMLATLVLSAGTPMLTAGDEFGRTQQGNNNAYCQDGPIAWVDWDLEEWQHDLLATTSHLLSLRSKISTLRPTAFYTNNPHDGDDLPDLRWLRWDGELMPEHLWFDSHNRVLQMLRSGEGTDRDVLVVFNGGLDSHEIRLPGSRTGTFELAWDSTWERPREKAPIYRALAMTRISELSVQVYLA